MIRPRSFSVKGFFEWTSEHLFGFYRNMIIIVNCILISTLLIHEGLAQGEIVSVLSYKFDVSNRLVH
ncbi:hypothetical protein Y032_0027g1511 [Ancylostoma ceylanicum]|uniref:Uncharacterized protein n=1 Tax=Ancylostoma ceylanicum TaxID=53326 RepID=A0A016UTZ3_9BILA|nr:hypothetical protein Y032_0027g1511 [Ancylostoma ceylanicum]